MRRGASCLARWIRIFERNPFYQFSDESVDERNRLQPNTERHNKKDNLDFSFYCLKYFENVIFKRMYIYILENEDATHFTSCYL